MAWTALWLPGAIITFVIAVVLGIVMVVLSIDGAYRVAKGLPPVERPPQISVRRARWRVFLFYVSVLLLWSGTGGLLTTAVTYPLASWHAHHLYSEVPASAFGEGPYFGAVGPFVGLVRVRPSGVYVLVFPCGVIRYSDVDDARLGIGSWSLMSNSEKLYLQQ